MSKKHEWLVLLLVFLVLFTFVILSPAFEPDEESQIDSSAVFRTSQNDRTKHIPLPSEVRGLYWTATTALSSRAQELLAYMKQTGLNTVVIDLKMDDGQLVIEDFNPILHQLAQENIYRIARIAVMRDGAFALLHPELALKTMKGDFWKDNIGSIWVDPAAVEVAEFAIALGKEAYARGFDEVQFDYARFASDGETGNIVYPVYQSTDSMVEVMQRFFQTIGVAMRKDHIPVSFDLFGMTFWSYEDFNIGQRLIDVLPYSDWISPMVYPSHYPNEFEGFANPAEEPYEIVKRSLDEGTKLTHGFWSGSEESLRAKWRPWLQDFDIGAVYTSSMIEAQIRAARDAGASGWILWNARNVYERANYLQ
jgi:hypothetical protein